PTTSEPTAPQLTLTRTRARSACMLNVNEKKPSAGARLATKRSRPSSQCSCAWAKTRSSMGGLQQAGGQGVLEQAAGRRQQGGRDGITLSIRTVAAIFPSPPICHLPGMRYTRWGRNSYSRGFLLPPPSSRGGRHEQRSSFRFRTAPTRRPTQAD